MTRKALYKDHLPFIQLLWRKQELEWSGCDFNYKPLVVFGGVNWITSTTKRLESLYICIHSHTVHPAVRAQRDMPPPDESLREADVYMSDLNSLTRGERMRIRTTCFGYLIRNRLKKRGAERDDRRPALALLSCQPTNIWQDRRKEKKIEEEVRRLRNSEVLWRARPTSLHLPKRE